MNETSTSRFYLGIMAVQQLLLMVLMLGILITLQRSGQRQKAITVAAVSTAIAEGSSQDGVQASSAAKLPDSAETGPLDIPFGSKQTGPNGMPLSAGVTITAVPIQTNPAPIILTVPPTPAPVPTAIAIANDDPFVANVQLTVNAKSNVHAISPYIYGISGGSELYLDQLRPTLNSWGGNPSTRYNWQLGNAWNAGHDWDYQNTNYGIKSGSASDTFLRKNQDAEIPSRLVVPTLGWVAKDSKNESCSFVDEKGNCIRPSIVDCANPPMISDPERTSVRSTPDDIRAWMQHLKDENIPVKYIAMDNEPMIWGFSHFDVHPTCTTYQEVYDKYVAYAEVVRDEMPDVELTGPVSCCWHFYWNSGAGDDDKELHDNQDFMPWFLDQMRLYEENSGERLLDVLDIHYYADGLYSSGADDPEIAARRLRAPAALWNGFYVDESWVGQEVFIIPRMKQLIAEHYPGTKFGISEWNFGADDTMNGALALADTLGIYGKFGVEFANYWRFPELKSPGYWAFKLYTNYDNEGGSFGDTSVSAEINNALVPTYASLDSLTGNLHIIVINKQITETAAIDIDLGGFLTKDSVVHQYRYAAEETDSITYAELKSNQNQVELTLPPYAIVHLIVEQP